MNTTGPKRDRGTLKVLGKYLDDALQLARMSQAELARQAHLQPPFVSQVMRGNRSVGRKMLITWCDILQCPEWLEECILNAAGYASRKQMSSVTTEERAEEVHQQVLATLQGEQPPQA